MTLLHLIKKDLLIAKRFLLTVILVLIVAAPLVFMLAYPISSKTLPFLYVVVLTEIMFMQSISQLEAKNPKAPALLCASPYARKTLVQAKYVLFVFLFAFCYFVYTVEALIVNPSNALDLPSILVALLCSVAVYGIYMPVELKYGVTKAKFIYMAGFLMLGLGPVLFTNLFAGVDFSMFAERIAAIPHAIKCFILALASILVFGGSMSISIRIFSKKDL